MKNRDSGKKQVNINSFTHQQLKILAAETGRKINNDLADDLLLLGIEEYRKVKKFTPFVTFASYKTRELHNA